MARTGYTFSDCSLKGYSIAILLSAVRGVHVFNVYPDKGAQLQLCRDVNSTYPTVMQCLLMKTLPGETVGHVAAEHAKLVAKWIDSQSCCIRVCIDFIL